MSEAPLISVAMATYNGAAFLEAQLQSIYDQDYSRVEILVADDGSTDATLEILDAHERSGRLRCIARGPNVGFVRNFERVLRHCRGSYIALADQDDLWLPNKLSRLVESLKSERALLVYSDAELVDAQGCSLNKTLWATLGARPVAGGKTASLYLRNCVTGCTVLLDRRLLEDALPIPDGFPFHDWWLAYAAAQRDGLRFVGDRLVQYRQHGSNVVGAGRRRRIGAYVARKLDQQRRFSRFAAGQIRQLEAFVSFERNHGLDCQLSTALVAWSRDWASRWSVSHWAQFFRDHPELFEIAGDPVASAKSALVPVKITKARAAIEAVLPVLFVGALGAWAVYASL